MLISNLISENIALLQIFLFVLYTSCEGFGSNGRAISENSKYFPNNLYDTSLKNIGKETFVLSPLSVAMILGMLREGADGLTREELNEVLRLQGLTDAQITEGFAEIVSSLHENNKAFLKVSNRMYISNSASVNPHFNQTLANRYKTSVKSANFILAKQVASDINDWVSQSTEGKITNLISPDGIEKDTTMILVNAVYFRGYWESPFNLKGTKRDKFHTENGGSSTVDFMRQEEVFPHVILPEFNAEALAMPYKGGRYGLVVVLPNKGTTLKEMEKSLLKSTALSDIPSKMTLKNVQLIFPKLRLESEVNFVESRIFEKIGLIKATDSMKANFSRMIDSLNENNVYVDTVVQKCFVDITEHGTEAGGATYVKVAPFNLRRTIRFEVNRPFVAYLFDSVTKSVLFILRKSS